ncbi:DUF2652 domain-containing protein [Flavihumibacter petaseus]|uniref:Uncharacterized protein n=1 Tax=Flavihumibacter petaseus NBRC 106054 TaxID=1220578 RepID=A0A0E9MVQ2_9BACT|nr:DUF2652 domain-containing protein [Flavihumibacter petaseus]GAO41568.1 hypothetical protein FPE01S_01_05820 [Flavihumibacter petaseus NBRC 106054]
MAEINATILIPDISGFTEFMSNTELSHGTMAINMLIDAIVKTVNDRYEVSEIEGDAVLLIKKDPAPSKDEMTALCLEIFQAFHFQRLWMQQHTVCPCRACMALENLSLKFIGHHGLLAEMRVGRFIKHSGPEMIVAHRLLKNGIGHHEYVLLTDNLLQHMQTAEQETAVMNWQQASEELTTLGKIDYSFALLTEIREQLPPPPDPVVYYEEYETPYQDFPVAADFQDAYMRVMNIPDRASWVPELQSVEQEFAHVFIGSKHVARYTDETVTISPAKMLPGAEQIIYAEIWKLEKAGISMILEQVFTRLSQGNSLLQLRFLPFEPGKSRQDIDEPTVEWLDRHLDAFGNALAEMVTK